MTISLPFFADPPEVSIQLGSKLNAVDIREGDDVYFECTIDAFPAAERISWKKDVSKPLHCTRAKFYHRIRKISPAKSEFSIEKAYSDLPNKRTGTQTLRRSLIF